MSGLEALVLIALVDVAIVVALIIALAQRRHNNSTDVWLGHHEPREWSDNEPST